MDRSIKEDPFHEGLHAPAADSDGPGTGAARFRAKHAATRRAIRQHGARGVRRCLCCIGIAGTIAPFDAEEGRRHHALTALRENATHEGALHLLASIKTRQNPFLGAWWHLNTRLSELGGRRETLVLIGVYVVVRLVSQILADTGHPSAAEAVRTLWLGVCVYTWVAPGIFRKMLEQELRQVRLRDGF